jgi:hypothetical protein
MTDAISCPASSPRKRLAVTVFRHGFLFLRFWIMELRAGSGSCPDVGGSRNLKELRKSGIQRWLRSESLGLRAIAIAEPSNQEHATTYPGYGVEVSLDAHDYQNYSYQNN